MIPIKILDVSDTNIIITGSDSTDLTNYFLRIENTNSPKLDLLKPKKYSFADVKDDSKEWKDVLKRRRKERLTIKIINIIRHG